MSTVRTLQIGEVGLLVEGSGLETERVDDVVDLDLGIFEGLVGFLSGGVGTSVYPGRGISNGL